ncbi:hypothetical protein CAC42_4644 [Sphaceloma murrayae]|uniref:Uncharacterized protein n=1 Tax=Sphaceloma murrayae TaxID=2082308 RepID=A0A2K1QP57_9PEZI|nr:hypothetical protein CAC42_4644 [Sphaceloma murrayae]
MRSRSTDALDNVSRVAPGQIKKQLIKKQQPAQEVHRPKSGDVISPKSPAGDRLRTTHHRDKDSVLRDYATLLREENIETRDFQSEAVSRTTSASQVGIETPLPATEAPSRFTELPAHAVRTVRPPQQAVTRAADPGESAIKDTPLSSRIAQNEGQSAGEATSISEPSDDAASTTQSAMSGNASAISPAHDPIKLLTGESHASSDTRATHRPEGKSKALAELPRASLWSSSQSSSSDVESAGSSSAQRRPSTPTTVSTREHVQSRELIEEDRAWSDTDIYYSPNSGRARVNLEIPSGELNGFSLETGSVRRSILPFILPERRGENTHLPRNEEYNITRRARFDCLRTLTNPEYDPETGARTSLYRKSDFLLDLEDRKDMYRKAILEAHQKYPQSGSLTASKKRVRRQDARTESHSADAGELLTTDPIQTATDNDGPLPKQQPSSSVSGDPVPMPSANPPRQFSLANIGRPQLPPIVTIPYPSTFCPDNELYAQRPNTTSIAPAVTRHHPQSSIDTGGLQQGKFLPAHDDELVSPRSTHGPGLPNPKHDLLASRGQSSKAQDKDQYKSAATSKSVRDPPYGPDSGGQQHQVPSITKHSAPKASRVPSTDAPTTPTSERRPSQKGILRSPDTPKKNFRVRTPRAGEHKLIEISPDRTHYGELRQASRARESKRSGYHGLPDEDNASPEHKDWWSLTRKKRTKVGSITLNKAAQRRVEKQETETPDEMPTEYRNIGAVIDQHVDADLARALRLSIDHRELQRQSRQYMEFAAASRDWGAAGFRRKRHASFSDSLGTGQPAPARPRACSDAATGIDRPLRHIEDIRRERMMAQAQEAPLKAMTPLTPPVHLPSSLTKVSQDITSSKSKGKGKAIAKSWEQSDMDHYTFGAQPSAELESDPSPAEQGGPAETQTASVSSSSTEGTLHATRRVAGELDRNPGMSYISTRASEVAHREPLRQQPTASTSTSCPDNAITAASTMSQSSSTQHSVAGSRPEKAISTRTQQAATTRPPGTSTTTAQQASTSLSRNVTASAETVTSKKQGLSRLSTNIRTPSSRSSSWTIERVEGSSRSKAENTPPRMAIRRTEPTQPTVQASPSVATAEPVVSPLRRSSRFVGGTDGARDEDGLDLVARFQRLRLAMPERPASQRETAAGGSDGVGVSRNVGAESQTARTERRPDDALQPSTRSLQESSEEPSILDETLRQPAGTTSEVLGDPLRPEALSQPSETSAQHTEAEPRQEQPTTSTAPQTPSSQPSDEVGDGERTPRARSPAIPDSPVPPIESDWESASSDTNGSSDDTDGQRADERPSRGRSLGRRAQGARRRGT